MKLHVDWLNCEIDNAPVKSSIFTFQALKLIVKSTTQFIKTTT